MILPSFLRFDYIILDWFQIILQKLPAFFRPPFNCVFFFLMWKRSRFPRISGQRCFISGTFCFEVNRWSSKMIPKKAPLGSLHTTFTIWDGCCCPGSSFFCRGAAPDWQVHGQISWDSQHVFSQLPQNLCTSFSVKKFTLRMTFGIPKIRFIYLEFWRSTRICRG